MIFRQKPAFSLIELLVVTTIIIVVSAIAMISYRTAGRNARDGKRQADNSQIRSALEIYRAENGSYPIHSSFASLMGNTNFTRYLSTPQMQDPLNVSPYFYTYTSNGAIYSVCYTQEANGLQVCRTNP